MRFLPRDSEGPTEAGHRIYLFPNEPGWSGVLRLEDSPAMFQSCRICLFEIGISSIMVGQASPAAAHEAGIIACDATAATDYLRF